MSVTMWRARPRSPCSAPRNRVERGRARAQPGDHGGNEKLRESSMNLPDPACTERRRSRRSARSLRLVVGQLCHVGAVLGAPKDQAGGSFQ